MDAASNATSEAEFVPKYLFISGAGQPATCKSRHVMKEFLRKRDSIRRQKQLAARSQRRVLPWLRREDIVRPSEQVDDFGEDVVASPESSFESISTATSPPQSQWTYASTAIDSHPSPPFNSSTSVENIPACDSEKLSENCHGHEDLVDYLFRVVICHLSGASQFSNISSPAAAMARYILNRPLPAQFLLATSSLSRDLASNRRSPCPDTIGLMLNGIRLLKEQIQKPEGLSEDSILAMVNLWMYEVVLIMDVVDLEPESHSRIENQFPKAVPNSIKTHIDGLERSIGLLGGLRSLSLMTLSLLAWCICCLPGYSTLNMRTIDSQSMDRDRGPVPSYGCLTRLLDRFSKIQKLSMCWGSQSNTFFQEVSFISLRRTLLRLTQMPRDETTPIRRLMRRTSLVSILLFIFDIVLGGNDTLLQESRMRRDELMQAQARLIDHNLDKEGSPEKAWQVLMCRAETPHLRLHSRAWGVVEMVNVIKQLKGSTIDEISRLLLGWLLPETCERFDKLRYERVVLQIRLELDGLANLS